MVSDSIVSIFFCIYSDDVVCMYMYMYMYDFFGIISFF